MLQVNIYFFDKKTSYISIGNIKSFRRHRIIIANALLFFYTIVYDNNKVKNRLFF
jgi:hypothetical protein